MAGLNTKMNEYAQRLTFFDDVPKSVLAALVVSYASRGGDFLENVSAHIAWEWHALYDVGIVPQKPSAEIRELGSTVSGPHGNDKQEQTRTAGRMKNLCDCNKRVRC